MMWAVVRNSRQAERLLVYKLDQNTDDLTCSLIILHFQNRRTGDCPRKPRLESFEPYLHVVRGRGRGRLLLTKSLALLGLGGGR